MMRTITVAVLAFISTNVDDLFLLTIWFLKRTRLGVVALGQVFGFSALLLISLLGYFGTTLIPQQHVHWLGVLPIAIGIKQLKSRHEEDNSPAESWWSVATVTTAHGGDNIAVYVPLFARHDLKSVALIVVCFYITLGFFVGVARIATKKLAHNVLVHRMAHRISPFVIIFIGVLILFS